MNDFIKPMALSFCVSVLASCGVLQSPIDAISDRAESGPTEGGQKPQTAAPLTTSGGQRVTANTGVVEAVSGSINIVEEVAATSHAASASNAGPIEQVYRTDRCNVLSRGGFIWFTNEVVLNDWLSPLQSDVAAKTREKIDFKTQGALLLDYGVAGSKGAGAEVVNKSLEIKGQEASVTVRQFKPSQGKRTAQVVTHPCALYSMPRSGFNKLVVISEFGDRLVEFDIIE